jgi:hypothetical protein
MGDFFGNGATDLVVANNGDGHLALFLGGTDELDLAGTFTEPGLAHPTDLEMDAITGQILGASEGVQAAIPIGLNTLSVIVFAGEGVLLARWESAGSSRFSRPTWPTEASP